MSANPHDGVPPLMKHLLEMQGGTGDTLTCPLCKESFDLPAVRRAPGIAAALGMSTDALMLTHAGSLATNVERQIDRHLRTHAPDEWLTWGRRYLAMWWEMVETMNAIGAGR